MKNVYDVLVLFYELCFSFNIFEKVMKKYFKRNWMNDNMIVYIEKYIFRSIDNEVIMQQF